MVSAALPATDSFTGTNNDPLSASWTTNGGGYDIQSNQVNSTAAAGQGLAHWNADTFGNDQYAQLVMKDFLSGLSYIGPAVRVAASAHTGYDCVSEGATLVLRKVVAASYTTLNTYTGTIAVNDLIRLEVSGTSLSCKQNGTERVTATDSAISSGSAGIGSYNQLARGDDFEGGNLGGSTHRIILE